MKHSAVVHCCSVGVDVVIMIFPSSVFISEDMFTPCWV